MSDTRFCQDSDFNVRIFGNYLYAVDGLKNYLHVYSIKDKQWNFSSLADLNIVWEILFWNELNGSLRIFKESELIFNREKKIV